MKKSMIYTRTGDAGKTSLVGGVRVSKTDERLEAYGTLDELNSFLGMLSALMNDEEEIKILQFIQNTLFAIGGYLATDISRTELRSETLISNEDISFLETSIDRLDASLPPLKEFVIPGGSYPASVCHVCRAICRRAERRILSLEEEGLCEIAVNYKCFINRLSDYLFVLSRKLNVLAQKNEIYWRKTCR